MKKILRVFDLIDAVEVIKSGKVAVIRTDTIYGIIASATNEAAVNRVYSIKARRADKPVILLVASKEQILEAIDSHLLDIASQYWPGPSSIILPAKNSPSWLTRGGGSLAYRIPDDPEVLSFLNETGPIIAPSANPEGMTPASNIDQAIRYFGDQVDIYVDGGVVNANTASRLARLSTGGIISWLR